MSEDILFTIKIDIELRQICVMLEACHMLKVARSTIAEMGTIMSNEGEFKLQVRT